MTPTADIGIKAKVHGEVHALRSGTLKRDDGTLENAARRQRSPVGAEVGAFGSSIAASTAIAAT